MAVRRRDAAEKLFLVIIIVGGGSGEKTCIRTPRPRRCEYVELEEMQKKSLEQEVRQKRDTSDRRRKKD